MMCIGSISLPSQGPTWSGPGQLWYRQHSLLLLLMGICLHGHPQDGHPLVLCCYPLRDQGPARTSKSSGSAPGAEPSEHSRPEWAHRRDTRGGSANKWSADAPAPWPNLYWLVCPRLSQRVGRLEHLGWVQQLQQQVASEPQGALASGLAAAHAAYGQTRWAALSEEDRCYAEEAGYAPKLRDMGVAGLEYPNQVCCACAARLRPSGCVLTRWQSPAAALDAPKVSARLACWRRSSVCTPTWRTFWQGVTTLWGGGSWACLSAGRML